MLHEDFINYRISEITTRLDDVRNTRQQYLAQLTLINDTLSDCKAMMHQKYDLTDPSVKVFMEAKDGLVS